jgi:SAM-dependent methyltransferase
VAETPQPARPRPDRETLRDAVTRERGGLARRISARARKILFKLRLGERWHSDGSPVNRRVYPSYDAYLNHQRNKFDHIRKQSIERHDRRFYGALRERLQRSAVPLARRSVLCLGARQGTEVRVFIDEGAFAVGIDLNPGPQNRYVVVGDFHDLQFAARSVDIVYTNALDHAFDLQRILAEVWRVLADDGRVFVEVSRGSELGSGWGFYESLSWSSVSDLLDPIRRAGFCVEQRSLFDEPWRGEQLLLRKHDGELTVPETTCT